MPKPILSFFSLPQNHPSFLYFPKFFSSAHFFHVISSVLSSYLSMGNLFILYKCPCL